MDNETDNIWLDRFRNNKDLIGIEPVNKPIPTRGKIKLPKDSKVFHLIMLSKPSTVHIRNALTFFSLLSLKFIVNLYTQEHVIELMGLF